MTYTSTPVAAWCQEQNDHLHSDGLCWAAEHDGNRDDPTYRYCDFPNNHAGNHHYSKEVTA